MLNFVYYFIHFDEIDAIYVTNLKKKKMQISEELSFDNYFIQIDPPNKENTTLILSVSSCYGYATFHILSEFNNLIKSYFNYSYDSFIYINLPEYINKEQLYIYFESFNYELDFTYDYVPYINNYSIKYSNLSNEIKIKNINKDFIKFEFYPFVFNEDVKYKLYLIKTKTKINCKCNFDNDNSFQFKHIFDIGIIRINENSINKIIQGEINYKFEERYYDLKLSILGTTVNNYKVEKFYKTITINGSFKNDDDNYFIIIKIIIIIMIILIIFCICRSKKNKNTNKLIEEFDETKKKQQTPYPLSSNSIN